MKIKKFEPIVLETLEQNKRARENDFILYGGVLKRLGISLQTNLFNFLATAKEKGMPSFAAITRIRRHIFEIREDLKDCETEIAREKEEQEYKIYNLTGLGE
jgi:hypothetical protein